MLRAADLPLPDQVWAHGFISFEGQRFSKSAGVWVELDQAVDFRGADALRYFLLAKHPSTVTAISRGDDSRSGTTRISPTRSAISRVAWSR
jgi:methionyl-tRNA synthetase